VEWALGGQTLIRAHAEAVADVLVAGIAVTSPASTLTKSLGTPIASPGRTELLVNRPR